VLFYRDKNSINKFQIATVTASRGYELSEPFALNTTWNFKRFHNPAEHLPGTW
jgi:20S proteasome subunit beta 7